MSEEKSLKGLKIVLFITALIFIFGVYPMMQYFPHGGFVWEPRNYEYEQMIVAIYITLGVFLLLAIKNPMKHLSLIWFTIISSFVHASVMLVQALVDASEHGNLIGDIPALYLIALLLFIFTPKKLTE